jgi:hypothetical protein
MTEPFDFTKVHYWRIEIIEPEDPEDQRCIFLHGDEGEIVGPLTIELAQAWINHFKPDRSPDDDSRGELCPPRL